MKVWAVNLNYSSHMLHCTVCRFNCSLPCECRYYEKPPQIHSCRQHHL